MTVCVAIVMQPPQAKTLLMARQARWTTSSTKRQSKAISTATHLAYPTVSQKPAKSCMDHIDLDIYHLNSFEFLCQQGHQAAHSLASASLPVQFTSRCLPHVIHTHVQFVMPWWPRPCNGSHMPRWQAFMQCQSFAATSTHPQGLCLQVYRLDPT